MQLSASQLGVRLADAACPLHGLYVLHGDEALLIQEAADLLRGAARQRGFTERHAHWVGGAQFDWSQVLASMRSPGLFAPRQWIELHLPSGKPGRDGGLALQELAALQAGQPAGEPDSVLLLLLPRLDRQTRASAWFAALEQAAVLVQLEAITRQALPQWIAQRLLAQGQCVEGGEAGQHSLQFFADRVEGNLLAAHQEVQKLALLYPRGPAGAPAQALSLAQIQAAVMNVARYDVYRLSEAVLSGQPARACSILDGLCAEGEAPVLVHWMLASDITALLHGHAALRQGRAFALVARELRIWGVRERLIERLLPRLAAPALAGLVQSAHQVDGIIKGLPAAGWPADSWQALQRLAMQLCALCLPAAGAALPARALRG